LYYTSGALGALFQETEDLSSLLCILLTAPADRLQEGLEYLD
jgi:hypothetical protein